MIRFQPLPSDRASVLLNIQALRALAAMLVVFVHLKPLARLAGLDPGVMNFGNAGVDLFFVISGVIMVFTAERRETRAGDFLAHRIVRIAPFYWFVTLVVFLVALAAPGLVQGTHASLQDLWRSLAFTPFTRPDGKMEPVVFVGWSLNYEMAFYLLFAATMLLRPRWLSFALCIAVICGGVAAGWALDVSDKVVGFYTYPIVLEFAAGVAIGWAVRRIEPSPRAVPIALAIGGLGLWGVVFGQPVAPQVDRVLASGGPAMALVASALVLERAGRRIPWRWPVQLGDASYSIYLTHFFVAQAVCKAAQALGLASPLALVGAGALAIGLAALVGVVVHLRVEAPLTAAVRRTVFRSRRRRPLPEAQEACSVPETREPGAATGAGAAPASP